MTKRKKVARLKNLVTFFSPFFLPARPAYVSEASEGVS